MAAGVRAAAGSVVRAAENVASKVRSLLHFTIHSIKDYVLLNCETHNAYNEGGFCNETILSDDFPELPAGKTQIAWTGGITAVEVTPRWWTL